MAKTFAATFRQIMVSILIGLLVIAFAVWGINDVFSGNSRNAVVSLGGDDVTTQDFSRAFSQRLAEIAAEEGSTMTHQQAYDRGVHRQVLQRLVSQKVIEVDAKDLGIGVNNRSAREYLGKMEVLQDEMTGKFSENKLYEVLSRQNPRIPLQTFEEDLINELRQRQTIPAINGGIIAPVEFAEQRYQYLTEQRRAKVLTLTAKSVAEPAEPTDEQLKAYIDEHSSRFTAPEYRKITMIRMEHYDFERDVSVTDEEIKAGYDYKLELGEIGSPERRAVVQITASSEAEAQQAAEQLEKGLSPSEAASLLGLIEPVIYDNVTQNAILDPETAEAAFDMNEGEIRTLLGGFGNWYAVQVTQVTPAQKPSMEDMKDELSANLIKAKAEEMMYDLSAVIEDELVEGRTLEEAAEAAKSPYSSLDYIDRSGTTRDGLRMAGLTGLEGIALDENLLTEIFVNEPGFETDMFQTSTGGWATIRVDEVIDSSLRPFDDVREQAAAQWKAEKTDAALGEMAADLAGRARQGEELSALAKEVGPSASLEDVIFMRSAPGQKIGGQVLVALLNDVPDDIEFGPGPQPMTRQVAELTMIIAATDTLAGEYAEVLQNQVTAALIGDLNTAYQAAVIADHEIKEFPEKLMQTLGLDANP